MRSNSQGEQRRRDPCTFCGKTNHRSRNCWENPANAERNQDRNHGQERRGNQQRNGPRRADHANQADVNMPILMMEHEKDEEKGKEPENDEISIHSCGVENEAIIDSGCSRHVCGKNYESKLLNVRRGPTIRVRMADRTSRESNKYGSLILRIKTERGPRKIGLGEVLYIEEITNLLLSMGMMTAKGAEFHMAKDHMTMSIGDIKTKITKREGENLYWLQIIEDDLRTN